jgi:hypothetical protein
MNLDLNDIAQRRRHLQTLAASQRAQLSLSLERFRTPFSLLDRGVNIVRFVRRYPLILGGASALFVALRPLRMGKWMRRGWMAWQLVSRLRKPK